MSMPNKSLGCTNFAGGTRPLIGAQLRYDSALLGIANLRRPPPLSSPACGGGWRRGKHRNGGHVL